MSKRKSYWNQGDKILLKNDVFMVDRYYDYYSNMGLNRFRWSNLPPGMESRHIENALFNEGQAVFFRNTNPNEPYDFLCLPCAPSNGQNIYGDPVHFNGIGVNKYFTNLSPLNAVRILDNDNALAPVRHIAYYTYLMAQIELTINMNLDQQKFPTIIGATKQNEYSMRRLYEKYSNFEPNILVDEKLAQAIQDGKGFDALKTQAPYLLDKLADFKKTCENELLTFLGINNTNNDKRERLLTDEVNANNSQITYVLEMAYKNRKDACKRINEMFGLNIQVEKVVDLLDVDMKGDIKNEGFNGEQ